jgi:hypothetical protein
MGSVVLDRNGVAREATTKIMLVLFDFCCGSGQEVGLSLAGRLFAGVASRPIIFIGCACFPDATPIKQNCLWT